MSDIEKARKEYQEQIEKVKREEKLEKELSRTRELKYKSLSQEIEKDTKEDKPLSNTNSLSLDLFENEFVCPKSKIKEIPVDKLDILTEKMGLIIADSQEEKTFLFDTKDIETFINNTTKYIIKDIQILDIKPQK